MLHGVLTTIRLLWRFRQASEGFNQSARHRREKGKARRVGHWTRCGTQAARRKQVHVGQSQAAPASTRTSHRAPGPGTPPQVGKVRKALAQLVAVIVVTWHQVNRHG